jgi:peptidoglycan hydrolase CwlO-like protein
MTVKEILEIENANTGGINLFKEGIFWRVYEKSAWRFVKNIREYRVFKKYVKAVKQDIAYLVFPESALSEILTTVETKYASSHTLRKSEIFVEIQGFTDTVGFEEWKAEITLPSDTEKIKDMQTKIDELMKQIQRLERIDLEKHFDKLQKTLSENSGAINAINLYLTNITQTLKEKLRN